MVDVVIAGAGPAGASLAIQLSARGHRVALVDRSEFPRGKLCGEFLSPEAFGHLRGLGLDGTVREVGNPIDRLHFAVDAARPLIHRLPEAGVGLQRFLLDRILVDSARERGVLWRPGTRVVAAGPIARANGAPATRFRVDLLAAGRRGELQARAVVNATGRAGGLRTRSRIGPTAVAFRRHFRWRRQSGNGLGRGVALFFFRGGYAGLGPVGEGNANLCGLCTLERFRREAIRPEEWFHRIASENRWLARAMEDLEPEGDEVTTTAGIPLAPTFPGSGPLLEIGDAGGSIAPVVGDGISMALRSAELAAPVLSDFLENRSTWDSALVRYRRDWRREFRRRLRVARTVERVVRSPRAARALLRAATIVPPLTSWLFRRTRGTSRGGVIARSVPPSVPT